VSGFFMYKILAGGNGTMRTLLAVWKAVTFVVTAIIVILLILLVGVRLIGLRPFVVLSDSMEPQYGTGSLLYVREVDPEDIKAGDVITFVMNSDLEVGTHRVAEVDKANSYFYTKGDADETADTEPVHFKNLIGIPLFSIPLLGYISSAIMTPAGIIAVIMLMLLLIVMSFVPDFIWGERRRPMTRHERRKYNRH